MKKIMVVDDEPDILMSMSSLLEGEGYAVLPAESARECLEKLRYTKPDLIIMDFFMPEMSGREAIERIRVIPGYEKIKIMFMTVAEFRDKGKQKLKELRISDYVTKPIDGDNLLKKIKKLVK